MASNSGLMECGFKSILALGLLVALPSCGEETEESPESESEGYVQRPAVIIDEATMLRLLAAMRELQDFSRAHPLVRQQTDAGPDRMPIGAGVTAFLGEGSLPILARHGFESARQFDSIMSYTQMAYRKIRLGDHGGFDGLDRRYQARHALREARDRLKKLPGQVGLSEDQKLLLAGKQRLEIEELERDLVEITELAEGLKENYDLIPAVNLETVRKHLVELEALMNP